MKRSASPLQASLLYAVLAAAWIVGSDAVLARLLGPRGLGLISPLKGVLFVVLSAPLLFLVLRRREARLRAEEARREAAEALYRRIFQRTFAAMLVLDGRDGRVRDANPAAERLYGLDRAALLARRIHDLSERSADELDQVLATAMREERTRWSSRHRTATGAWRDVEVHTSAIESGEAPLLVSIVHDITERLAGEQLLREAESRYRLLLERAADPIVILDLQLHVLEANERARQLLGYEAHGLVGLHARELVTPGQLERQPVRFAELAAGRTVHSERTLRRSDGREVQVEMSSRLLSEGEFELILRDVTERRQTEDRQRQQQKLEALGQLAGGIAHDLNNVLTVVLANAALVRTALEDATDDPLADLMELETSAQRGVVMVRKLLSFGRAAPLAIRPVDVAVVVRELEPTLRRLLPAHIEIVCEAPRAGPAMADAGALEQMLVNLATNARDALPNGGRLMIAVYPAASIADRLIIEVRDDGIGMSAETQRRVFEPFFTTKPVGEGTGLGLTVVYGLVMQQFGTISIESEPGSGTCIRIALPAAERHDVPMEPVPSDAPDRWPRGTETILLVEDEDALRTSAARILARLGYTVLSAADGHDGLAVFARERARCQLVLSDVVMPRMSGKALFDAVRAEAPATRFLFMSGYGAADLHDLQAAYGGNAPMLPKPWTAGELARAVRHALDSP